MFETADSAVEPLEAAARQRRQPHAHRCFAQRPYQGSGRRGGPDPGDQGRDHARERYEVSRLCRVFLVDNVMRIAVHCVPAFAVVV